MKKFQVSGKRKGEVLVDDDVFDWASGLRWHINDNGYVLRQRSKIEAVTESGPKFERLHRKITGAPDGIDVDHINGNRLDNRRENLRLCSRSQNLRNQTTAPRGATGIRGVSYYRLRGTYEAYYFVSGKKYRIGYFNTLAEAAVARKQAEARVYGQFAPKSPDVQVVRK